VAAPHRPPGHHRRGRHRGLPQVPAALAYRGRLQNRETVLGLGGRAGTQTRCRADPGRARLGGSRLPLRTRGDPGLAGGAPADPAGWGRNPGRAPAGQAHPHPWATPSAGPPRDRGHPGRRTPTTRQLPPRIAALLGHRTSQCVTSGWQRCVRGVAVRFLVATRLGGGPRRQGWAAGGRPLPTSVVAGCWHCSGHAARQVVSQRSLHLGQRKTSSGVRGGVAQCCPAPLQRCPMTTVGPRAPLLLPKGSSTHRKGAESSCATRFSK
jgi:hypothetical protein